MHIASYRLAPPYGKKNRYTYPKDKCNGLVLFKKLAEKVCNL